MKHEKSRTVLAMVYPPAVMALLLLAVLISGRGITPQARPPQLDQLSAQENRQNDPDEQPQMLVLTGGLSEISDTVSDTLDQMRIPFARISTGEFDLAQLEGVEAVLVCTGDLSGIDEEVLVSLFSWIEKGGRLALMCVPDMNSTFRIISRKLGIMDMGSEYYEYSSVRFADGMLPVFADTVFDEELSDFALTVFLEPDCAVLVETADEAHMPVLWRRVLGEGRLAVFNGTLAQGKDGRGFVLDTLFAICDTLCYPIINAAMVFVDDFPAPQPEGYDERLKAQYGYDVQGFFRNHWWPDMKELTYRYGVRYSGVLVETYNANMEPPFLPDNEERALIRYYTSEILHAGGEVGLHGYNHQPLCLDNFEYAGEGYTPWSSRENMALSIRELLRYGHSFLPDAEFKTYVPPSNYLSDEGKEVLLETVPSLSVISGLYLSERGINARVQEFAEEEDGSISVPRITSGFSVSIYSLLTMDHELLLHGVLSHFIHPDDVLDEARGAALGWERMLEDFDALFEKVISAYPALRFCTASEGAAAVQRYDRVRVTRTWDESGALNMTLSPFYDEVWLALLCREAPSAVENAQIYEIGGGLYWLRATDAHVRVEWEENP